MGSTGCWAAGSASDVGREGGTDGIVSLCPAQTTADRLGVTELVYFNFVVL